jgi:hypothetical protein
MCARGRGKAAGNAESDQLVEAILYVESEPAEGSHQRLDVETLLRTRAQEPEEAGPER